MTPTDPLIPVDRVRAALRGGGIAGAALLLLLAARGIAGGINWPVMRATEPLSFAIALFFLGLLMIAGLVVLCRGGQWLLLAAWHRPVAIEFGREALVLRVGPFGTHRLPWSEIRRSGDTASDDEDAFAADDEPVLPALGHPRLPGDLVEQLVRFSGARPDELQPRLALRLPHLFDAATDEVEKAASHAENRAV